MEFMSSGLPAVVSATRIDRYYFDDSQVRFFESGNAEGLAEALSELHGNRALRDRQVRNALAYARRNSWEVDDLVSGRAPAVDFEPSFQTQ